MKYIKKFEGLMNKKTDEDKFPILRPFSADEFKNNLLKAVDYVIDNSLTINIDSVWYNIKRLYQWQTKPLKTGYSDLFGTKSDLIVRKYGEDTLIVSMHKLKNEDESYAYEIIVMLYDRFNNLYVMKFHNDDYIADMLYVDFYINVLTLSKFIDFLYYIINSARNGTINESKMYEYYGILLGTNNKYIYKFSDVLSYLTMVKTYVKVSTIINHDVALSFIIKPMGVEHVKEYIDKKGVV